MVSFSGAEVKHKETVILGSHELSEYLVAVSWIPAHQAHDLRKEDLAGDLFWLSLFPITRAPSERIFHFFAAGFDSKLFLARVH